MFHVDSHFFITLTFSMLNAFKPYIPVISLLERPPVYTVESLTRDVDIKPLHSHNDYWRKVPFYDAVSHGFQSIESDIWKFKESYTVQTDTETTIFSDKEVYVGHNQVLLKLNGTLDTLYLEPLFQLLKSVNPRISNLDSSVKHGIFYNSPETTVYLWMDIKLEGDHTYEHVFPKLQQFIDNDYLSYYDFDTKTKVERPVTVILTGNLPSEDLITHNNKVYTFLDAPLATLGDLEPEELAKVSQFSVVASGSMEEVLGHRGFINNPFSDSDLEHLSHKIEVAHNSGLKTRIWGGIDWPKPLVYLHNSELYRVGCDLINTNDLEFGQDKIQ